VEGVGEPRPVPRVGEYREPRVLKKFRTCEIFSIPGGPTTSGFPVPEDGVVSSDRETHLALTAAGGTDRDRYVSSRRGSVMLPEQKNLPVNKIAPPSFVVRF
jgi:hypothetical protein